MGLISGQSSPGFIWVVVNMLIPFWGTLNIRCRIRIGIQKGTRILTTTLMTFGGLGFRVSGLGLRVEGFGLRVEG